MLPASTYDRATASTSSGRVRFQTSAGFTDRQPALLELGSPGSSVMTSLDEKSESSRLMNHSNGKGRTSPHHIEIISAR